MAKCRYFYNCANNTLCKKCKEYEPEGNYEGTEQITVVHWLYSKVVWALAWVFVITCGCLAIAGIVYEFYKLILHIF